MTIYFARHGESEANLLHEFSNTGFKHPLTAKGAAQAQALAQKLCGIPFARVYSSPVLRAIQTAAIVTASLQIPSYEVHEYLREYDVGVLEGRSDPASWAVYAACDEQWQEPRNRDLKIGGGESFNQVQQRFQEFIDAILVSYPLTHVHVLVVTHGGLLKIGLPKVVDNLTYEFTVSHIVGNCELIVCDYENGQLVCRHWNTRPVD